MKSLFFMMTLLASAVGFSANRESGGRLSAAAVYVDFRSIGAGIDTKTQDLLNSDYKAALARGQVVNFTKQIQGREGEVRYCLQLTTANLSHDLIKTLASSILLDADQHAHHPRTSVRVWTDCSSYDSATEQDLTKY